MHLELNYFKDEFPWDCDCGIVVSSDSITLLYWPITLGKIWAPLFSKAMDQLSTLLSFCRNGFGIK